MSFLPDQVPYLPVFVYGTLRPGQTNYGLLRGFTVTETPAQIANMDLFALPDYPMALSGSRIVVGDLLFLTPTSYRSLLLRLDDLEGWIPELPNCQFRRIQCRATIQGQGEHDAWMYIGNRTYLGTEPELIDHGDWVRYRSHQASSGLASYRWRDSV